MINRLLIRTRVLQTAYAHCHKGDSKLQSAEIELERSLKQTYDLYLFLLQLIPSLTEKYAEILEARQNAYLATNAERRPNMRLIHNRLSGQIADSLEVQSWYASFSMAWDEEETLLRSLIKQIEDSELYAEYLKSENNYENDKAFWVSVFKKIIAPSILLSETLEDKSIYWDNTLLQTEKMECEEQPNWEALDTTFREARGSEHYSASRLEIGVVEIVKDFVEKTLRRAEENIDFDTILIPPYRDESDEKFAMHLLRQTLLNTGKYSDLISEYISESWDKDRLADIDFLLMQMAVTEYFHFPSIPTNITINEYVELSKVYSTPKSSGFINGVLDNIAKALREEGKIFK